MAINGAEAIRPLGSEIRVARAQAAKSHDQSKREPSSGQGAQPPEPVKSAPKPVSLPDFVGRDLSFRHDEELNRVIVEVIDAKTREVVRTIPPEEVVNALKTIRRAQGALLDEEA